MMNEISMIIEGNLGKLRGMIHKPEENSKGVFILLHGYFSSNKLGPSNLYVQIARSFAKLGFEFWRFDSYGVGDSDGDFSESTYSLRLEDYSLITEKALKYYNKVNYLGHSLGANLGVNLSIKFSNNVDKVFLLAPTFGKIAGIKKLFSESQLSDLNFLGRTDRQGMAIKKDFLDDITSEKIYKDIEKSFAKLILIYGTSDDFYDKTSIEKALSFMKNYLYIEIKDSDHNFLYHKDELLEILKESLVS